MRQVVVSIRDDAMGAFSRPFFCPSVQFARRVFADACFRDDPDTETMRKSPQDFALFHLGFFDEETGRFESLDVPERLCYAKDVLSSGGSDYAST